MRKKKILVAVNEESLPHLEKTFSNRDKFNLTVVESGLDACRFIEREKPRLAFMDVYLPGLNGDACCYSIKRENACRSTYIVLLAYAGRGGEAERCRRAGCDAVLEKPIDDERLAEIINRFLYAGKRSVPRYKVRLTIHYGTEPQELLTNYAVNISTGGLFLETGQVLPVETPLTIAFTLPVNNAHITCRARVAWVNGPIARSKPLLPVGMGLQFLDLGLEDLRAIRDFLDKGNLSPTW